MRDLIFDTETTGKYEFKKPSDDPSQPDIVQLAAILVEGTFIRASINLILAPTKKCEEEAAKVHGISQEVIDRFGVPMNVGIPMFSNLLKRADRLVAHNIQFDLNVVGRAFKLLGASTELLGSIPKACTMLSSMNIVKIPSKSNFGGQYKWPKLIEAYKHLVDPAGFEGAHDAMIDVTACWKVLQALNTLNAPILPVRSM